MNNKKALDAFIARKAEIDAMLSRLQKLSDDHFDVSPDDVQWGHVGVVAALAARLRESSDAIFHEGEYASDRN